MTGDSEPPGSQAPGWLKTRHPNADTGGVKGLEKLTSIRLAEVLTQKGVIPADVITEALYIQDKLGEGFVDVLVSSGHISEWDLARVVVESFQLPFILAGNYQVSDEARSKLPKEEFFKHLIVPLDTFGDILTVSMPVLTTAETLLKLEATYDVEIFPYVGLISENKRVLAGEFSEFKAWHKQFTEERERRSNQAAQAKPSAASGDAKGDWADLFDDADEAVRNSIKGG